MQLRDKLQKELRVLMTVVPLVERAALEAVQQVNIDGSAENVSAMMEAMSKYRGYSEVLRFIVRILDEDDAA